MNKKTIIGIIIFIILVGAIVFFKNFSGKEGSPVFTNLTTVYVATGGGKEDFLADPDVTKILKKKYGLNVVWDTWSNGKTISLPLIPASVNFGVFVVKPSFRSLAPDSGSGFTYQFWSRTE